MPELSALVLRMGRRGSFWPVGTVHGDCPVWMPVQTTPWLPLHPFQFLHHGGASSRYGTAIYRHGSAAPTQEIRRRLAGTTVPTLQCPSHSQCHPDTSFLTRKRHRGNPAVQRLCIIPAPAHRPAPHPACGETDQQGNIARTCTLCLRKVGTTGRLHHSPAHSRGPRHRVCRSGTPHSGFSSVPPQHGTQPAPFCTTHGQPVYQSPGPAHPPASVPGRTWPVRCLFAPPLGTVKMPAQSPGADSYRQTNSGVPDDTPYSIPCVLWQIPISLAGLLVEIPQDHHSHHRAGSAPAATDLLELPQRHRPAGHPDGIPADAPQSSPPPQ